MKKIDSLIQMKFDITWEIIRLGWLGPGDFQRQLSVDEISAFAEVEIEKAYGIKLDYISELCVTKDEESIDENLMHLSPEISERTVRIWRVLLLKELLDILPDDPLKGLIELTDFWLKFGNPEDSPHTIQGVGNIIQPLEYYTDQNYINIISKHKTWVDKEKNNLLEIGSRKNDGEW